jgi:hypothetical protein
MNNRDLAKTYITKAIKRLKVLHLLKEDGFYYEVTQEAQTAIELALKGILAKIKVKFGKHQDIGHLILEYRENFPKEVAQNVDKLVSVYRWRPNETAYNFWGCCVIKTIEDYNEKDARLSLNNAEFIVEMGQLLIRP